MKTEEPASEEPTVCYACIHTFVLLCIPCTVHASMHNLTSAHNHAYMVSRVDEDSRRRLPWGSEKFALNATNVASMFPLKFQAT